MDVQRRGRTRLLSPALWALMLVLGLASTSPARSASGAIVRCMTADGASVYTDQPCAFSGARPAPMSTALVARLVSEAHVAHEQGVEAALPLGAGEGTPPSGITRRPAADGCARTPRQLAVDVRGSLALGDVNRLAESYHWVGMHTREGRRTMDRLAQLLGHEAVATQYYAAQMASLSDDESRGGDGGILQVMLAGDGAPSLIEFDVQRYAGCYFVRFPSDGATIA